MTLTLSAFLKELPFYFTQAIQVASAIAATMADKAMSCGAGVRATHINQSAMRWLLIGGPRTI